MVGRTRLLLENEMLTASFVHLSLKRRNRSGLTPKLPWMSISNRQHCKRRGEVSRQDVCTLWYHPGSHWPKLILAKKCPGVLTWELLLWCILLALTPLIVDRSLTLMMETLTAMINCLLRTTVAPLSLWTAPIPPLSVSKTTLSHSYTSHQLNYIK